MSIKDGIAMIDFVTNPEARKHIEENENDKFLECDRKEEARIQDLEEKEECLSERQRGHRDSGMCESDFY